MSYLIQSLVGTMTSLMLAQPMEFTRKNCIAPVELYEKLKPSVVKILVKTPKYEASGTGLVVDSDGDVITSTHVVSKSTSITIIDSNNGKKYPYKIKKIGDAESVSSLSPIKNHPEKFVSLSKSEIYPGESVYLIGYPFEYQILFSSGIYMGDEISGGRRYLLTNSLINPGNSGSGVFDCSGNVIGFVLAVDVRTSPMGILNPTEDAMDVM